MHIRVKADSWDNDDAPRNHIPDTTVPRKVSNAVSLGRNIYPYHAGAEIDNQHSVARKAELSEIAMTTISASGGGDKRYLRTCADTFQIIIIRGA